MSRAISLLVAVGLASLPTVALAQATATPPALPTTASVSVANALADATEQLGRCQTDLGPLTQLKAAVMRGQLVSAAQVLDAVAKANPTLTIDRKTLTITPKSAGQ